MSTFRRFVANIKVFSASVKASSALMISFVITIIIIVITIITIIIMITLFCSETLHFALARIRITPACPYLKLTLCYAPGVDYDLEHGVDDDVGDGLMDTVRVLIMWVVGAMLFVHVCSLDDRGD